MQNPSLPSVFYKIKIYHTFSSCAYPKHRSLLDSSLPCSVHLTNPIRQQILLIFIFRKLSQTCMLHFSATAVFLLKLPSYLTMIIIIDNDCSFCLYSALFYNAAVTNNHQLMVATHTSSSQFYMSIGQAGLTCFSPQNHKRCNLKCLSHWAPT